MSASSGRPPWRPASWCRITTICPSPGGSGLSPAGSSWPGCRTGGDRTRGPAGRKDLESPGPGCWCTESRAGPEVGVEDGPSETVGAVGGERSASLLLPAAPGPAPHEPRLPGLPQPHLVALSPRPASCPRGTSLCGVSRSSMPGTACPPLRHPHQLPAESPGPELFLEHCAPSRVPAARGNDGLVSARLTTQL